MELTKELKERIDNYFDNISSKDLLELAVSKYGFSEINFDLENQKFSTLEKSDYFSNLTKVLMKQEELDCVPLAA
jgi:hypothetical protein